MTRRINMWELVAAVAAHACMPRVDHGPRADLSPYRVAHLLDRLARTARSLRRYDELACNVGMTDATERAVARLERRVAEIGTELGVVISHQRDPRGATLHVWADMADGRLLGVL